MSIGDVLLWGFVATALLTTLLAGAQALGLTRMGIPYLLGTILTPARDRAVVIGHIVHVLVGWLFALLYAAGFERLGAATVWIGMAGGLVHALFVLTVLLPLLPGIHPRMVSEAYGPTPNAQVQPPGSFGLHYGRHTPIVTIVAHVAYGAVLGGLYRVVG